MDKHTIGCPEDCDFNRLIIELEDLEVSPVFVMDSLTGNPDDTQIALDYIQSEEYTALVTLKGDWLEEIQEGKSFTQVLQESIEIGVSSRPLYFPDSDDILTYIFPVFKVVEGEDNKYVCTFRWITEEDFNKKEETNEKNI